MKVKNFRLEDEAGHRNHTTQGIFFLKSKKEKKSNSTLGLSRTYGNYNNQNNMLKHNNTTSSLYNKKKWKREQNQLTNDNITNDIPNSEISEKNEDQSKLQARRNKAKYTSKKVSSSITKEVSHNTTYIDNTKTRINDVKNDNNNDTNKNNDNEKKIRSKDFGPSTSSNQYNSSKEPEMELFDCVQNVLLNEEKAQELCRRELVLQDGFFPLSIFNFIDKKLKGWFVVDDFEEFLNKIGIYLSDKDRVIELYGYYDRSQRCLQNYDEFCKMLEPRNTKHNKYFKQKRNITNVPELNQLCVNPFFI